MKALRLPLLALFLLGSLALAQNTLTAQNAWIGLLPTPTLAAYLTLSNPTDRPIRVLGVSTPVALKAEFHETRTVGGTGHGAHGETATMVPLREVVVPAKGKLEFKPGGKHIMLMGLKRALKVGEKVPLVLKLDGGQSLTVQAVVKGP
jgi:copper(I)-binding protein